LWETVAADASKEWQAARQTLESAEERLREMEAPENAPLGLIGDALQSGEVNATREQFYAALADFTKIDETLRQREDLRQALALLIGDHLSAEKSLQLSAGVESVSAELGKALHEEEPRKTRPLRADFGAYARKILGRVIRRSVSNAPSP
jgi:hypothetical protein